MRHNMIKACVGGALTRLADAMDTNKDTNKRGPAAEEEEDATTTEGPLVAPAPEAAQGRNSFSQASSSAGPRLSGGSRGGSPRGMSPRGGSPRFSGGPRFAGARPAVVTPAGDETDGESGSDSQASASCDHTQCPLSYTV